MERSSRKPRLALWAGDARTHAVQVTRRASIASRRLGGRIRAGLVLTALLYGLTLLYLSYSWGEPTMRLSSHFQPGGTSDRRLSPTEQEDDAYPQRAWQPREFECVRWIGTDDGGELTGETRECWQRVRGGEAGFCEVRNATNGELFHVMRTTTLSLKEDVRFTCRFAERFTSFRHLARNYKHDPPMAAPPTHRDDGDMGIAMAVHEGVLSSAYASIRQLRDVGCRLPIELWTRFDEVGSDHPAVRDLMAHYGPVRLRHIFDQRIHGFYVKAHAVYYSSFTKLLLLDADNFALHDPTPLFHSTAFRRHGAIFWPDFWHPGNTIFNVHAQSLLWELLDLSYVDMLEQESGQVVIDRARCRDALERLMFFATQRPNIFNKLLLVWGDKDLFRLAWMHVGKSFFFNDQRLPGSMGVINVERQRFCGLSMVQYDVDGKRMLFLHRNTVKLTATIDPSRRIWQALQEYAVGASPPPTIHSFNGEKLFNETSCFGVKRFATSLQATLVEMRAADLIVELAGLEGKLVAYARAWQRLVQLG